MSSSRWRPEALVPIVSGLVWLWFAESFGMVGFVFSVIPGCLLVASGVALVFWPGDVRIPEFAAAGGLLGIPLALPSVFVAGFGTMLLLVGLSLASFVAAGFMSLRLERPERDVPVPERTPRVAAQVAADEALLAWMQLTLPMPAERDWSRILDEVARAREVFGAAGWLEKPADFHRPPPPLAEADVELRPRRVRGVEFQQLSFESGYEPRPEEPGAERWQSYAANRTAHAWIFRHDGPPRPWLIGLHGFQMGWPLADLALFAPEYFHRALGMNLVVPTLPLHGLRRQGRRSGDGFLAGDALDTVHAEAQAMWDVRRVLSWVRAQGAPRVGVLGCSLGGYQTALLACLEEDLACVVAGIPLTDISRAVWRHGPSLLIKAGEDHGLEQEHVAEVLRVVSPLALEPLVSHERRFIFAGNADRLVPPDQPRDLWDHWGRPRIQWYQGAHLTFRAHSHVRHFVRHAFVTAGLTA